MDIFNNDNEFLLEFSNDGFESGQEENLTDENYDPEEDSDSCTPVKKSYKKKSYQIWHEFATRDEFLRWWKSQDIEENCTVKRLLYQEYWTCKFARKQGYNCFFSVKIDFNEEHVSVSKSEAEHDHNAAPCVVFTKEILDFVKSRVGNFTAGQIHSEILKAKIMPLPNQKQIQNLVSRLRSKPTKFTDFDLLDYCKANQSLPDDEDKPYVFTSTIQNSRQFCVAWTTTKLIKQIFSSSFLQVDSTYNLAHNLNPNNKFVVQVGGFTDVNHRFKLCFVAIARLKTSSGDEYKPNTVLADGSKSVTKAVREIFGNSKRSMCWAHLFRLCQDKTKRKA